MSYFNEFVEIILNFEGGFVNHPDDNGSATKYGISLRFAQGTDNLELFDINNDGIIDIEDIRLLSKNDAINVYYKYFWKPLDLDKFQPRVALILFGMYVNHNPKSVVRILQKCLRRLDQDVIIDGLFGPQTKTATMNVNQNELSELLLCKREEFYYKIVKNNPSQQIFLKGWINHRIDKLRKISLKYALL